MKRYQECNKLEKAWRCRWYLLAPFLAFWSWVSQTRVYEDDFVDDKIVHTNRYRIASFKLCWSLALGKVECDDKKINYYFTTEEVFGKIKKKIKKKKK